MPKRPSAATPTRSVAGAARRERAGRPTGRQRRTRSTSRSECQQCAALRERDIVTAPRAGACLLRQMRAYVERGAGRSSRFAIPSLQGECLLSIGCWTLWGGEGGELLPIQTTARGAQPANCCRYREKFHSIERRTTGRKNNIGRIRKSNHVSLTLKKARGIAAA